MPLNQLQIGSPVARRALFVVLLVASLVLASLYAREGEGGPIHGVQNSVMGAAGHVNSAGAGLGTTTEAAVDALADLTANPTTLSGLRAQNEELRELLSNAEEYRQEVNRLQSLLNMKQSTGVTGPVAHVIGRSANAWDQSITIDLGTEEGVTGGMTVVGASGVIGQVSRAQAHTSTVRLLTDPNSGAAVMIQSSRANGIVRGSISGLLYLEDLDEDVIPEKGDVVVTSGLGGSYERGLIVGTVVSVNKTESDASGAVIVDPNGSTSMLEEVIVVFSAPDTAAADKAKEEAAAKKAAQQNAAEGADGEGDEGDSDGEGVYQQTATESDGGEADDGSDDQAEPEG